MLKKQELDKSEEIGIRMLAWTSVNDLHDTFLVAALVHPQVVVDGGRDLAAGDVQFHAVSAHHQVTPEHCGGERGQEKARQLAVKK